MRSWVPQDSHNWRDSSWQTSTPREWHRYSLKHIPSISMREACLLVQKFQPEGQASSLAHNWGPSEVPSGNIGHWRPSLCSPSALLQLNSFSQKGDDTFVWCLNFCSSRQGKPLRCLALMARGACVLGSHRIVTIGEIVLCKLPPPRQSETHPAFL